MLDPPAALGCLSFTPHKAVFVLNSHFIALCRAILHVLQPHDDSFEFHCICRPLFVSCLNEQARDFIHFTSFLLQGENVFASHMVWRLWFIHGVAPGRTSPDMNQRTWSKCRISHWCSTPLDMLLPFPVPWHPQLMRCVRPRNTGKQTDCTLKHSQINAHYVQITEKWLEQIWQTAEAFTAMPFTISCEYLLILIGFLLHWKTNQFLQEIREMHVSWLVQWMEHPQPHQHFFTHPDSAAN